jgi:hypothetical protein
VLSDGGAIIMNGNSSLNIYDCNFIRKSAFKVGVIKVGDKCIINIKDTSFINNFAL